MEDKVLAALQAHAYTRTAPVVIQSFESTHLRYLRGRIGRNSNILLLQLLDEPDMALPDVAGPDKGRRYRDLLTPAGLREVAHYADAIGPEVRMVVARDANNRLAQPTGLVQAAHAAGLQVHVYTFRPENSFLPSDLRDGGALNQRNEAGSIAEIRRYLEAGVDAFFTDDPALGRRAVDGR